MSYDVAAVHHVGVGETPASIAECYGCDALDLVLANPQKRFVQLASGELAFVALRAGEFIIVPGAPPPPELSGGFMGSMGQLPTGVQNLGAQGQQAAGQVQQLYQGLTPAEQQQLSQLLQSNGITIPGDVQKSVSAMANLGNSAIQEIGMLSGSQGTLTQINAATSLIAGAVTLIPGAGLVLGAGIAGGLAIFDNLAKAFGWFQQPTEVCAWKIPPTPSGSTGICFSTPQRPYGPTSPTWLTIENFANAPTGPGMTKDPTSGAQWQDVYWPNDEPMETWLDEFGTGDWSFGWNLGAELTRLGDTGIFPQWFAKIVAASSNFASPALQTATDLYTQKWYTNPGLYPFALAFDRALIKSFEYPLNGFPAINAYTLLLATSEAWNAKYTGGTPVTFDGTGNSMVDLVVKGQVDAWFDQGGRQGASSGGSMQQYPPVTINVSNVLSSKAIQLAATGGGGAAAPTSTATKVAVGGVVTGAALTGLWLALGRPATWAAFKAAFSHAWKSV